MVNVLANKKLIWLIVVANLFSITPLHSQNYKKIIKSTSHVTKQFLFHLVKIE